MEVVEFEGLAQLRERLRTIDGDAVVLAVPPGAFVASLDDARDAYDALDGSIVLAASSAARVPDELVAVHPSVDTPHRFVAGDALAGPARALDALAAGAAGATDDADYLTRRFLAGDDLELDVGAELFLVVDGAPASAAPVIIGAELATIRVVAYDGAVADHRPHARVVAPEILVVPFWTASYCAAVVDAANAADAWTSDADDPVPGVEVSLATITPRLFATVEAHVGDVVVPALRAEWPEFAWNGLADAFVIRYTPGPTASLPLHHDVAQISASARLNDGYAGGALEFPRQRWDNASVPVGDLVAWPSLVTHPHRSAPVTDGVKYGLTLWFALPS